MGGRETAGISLVGHSGHMCLLCSWEKVLIMYVPSHTAVSQSGMCLKTACAAGSRGEHRSAWLRLRAFAGGNALEVGRGTNSKRGRSGGARDAGPGPIGPGQACNYSST